MTLTREEILAMEPGPELDKLIAEHVMGWSIYRFDKDVPERCYYMLVDKSFDPVVDGGYWNAGERKTEEEAWNDNRPFSTDISAAWEVLNKVIEMGMEINVGFYQKWDCALDYRGTQWNEQADTAPEAICKTALLAVLGL
ncbi:hypothetical protein KDC22_14345 [Paenibacillus tritici]|uniref:BC1872 family protein n=1 Tax=Paenibacillus tritici TaxID=1873425 RepID=UPI001BA9CDEF|nr:hypothetical protein [Paenibacillus tritici]QUL57546.1 hypothetical protein KDC22_14345 [Paenibacillus tritici]